ncbi:hypothetical protein NQ317_006851 [Molorchus minor]|uniref:Nuclear hormone receptor HR96 n=1 Tax=Molorchus minor TaxID=1323400 RepID=A0ABQ9K0W1_9CUCU|nr:hypothetical protein NQ317_006851 [Molorchus minor]
MKGKVDPKVCSVCGDKALGYNFNAVTCESCKAFFRRNAIVQKEFKCPFNNQCEITTVTRRFCQKCRLDKCFSIGMCKDLIMSEQDKVAKQHKKRINGGFKTGFKKIKKETFEPDSQESEYTSSVYNTDSDSKDTNLSEHSHQPSNINILTINCKNPEKTSLHINENISLSNERLVSSSDDISMIKNILSPNESNQRCDNATCTTLNKLINNNDTNCNNNTNKSPNSPNISQSTASKTTIEMTKDVVNDVHRMNSVEPSPIESILCEAIKLEFEAFSSIAQYNSNSRELNDAERAKLNELIVANKALLSPVDEELNNLIGGKCKFKDNPQQMLEADPALVDVINLTTIGIRRLIKMAKKINAFKNMCQEDQLALLKGGCTEIMILRSAMNYDLTKQTWEIPHTQENLNVNVDILKLAKGNMYQEHERFIKTFDTKWRGG